MKRAMTCIGIFFCLIMMTMSQATPQLKPDVIESIKITDKDIPGGFIYGKVPEVYKKTLKYNPWMMDRSSIKRLADKIYPGGDHNKIATMHVSIIAKENKPYGDDIVCYVILYKDMKAAREEIKKVTEFTGYNSDRCILLVKENLAVFLFVDDITNFHHIRDMAVVIEERMNKL